MRINLIPLYAWYVLVVGGDDPVRLPAADRRRASCSSSSALFDWPFFDPARGGDPLLWQHLFWIFGHPEVYIIFLPSVALVAMIVPTFARTPIVGYGWIVLAAVGTGFLSFGLWVHHMFTTGLPGISLGVLLGGVGGGGDPDRRADLLLHRHAAGRAASTRSVPMLFVFGGLAIFVLGGLTGVMVALAPFDFQAHDTFFVVGHLHYVLIGGTLFPVVAGLLLLLPAGQRQEALRPARARSPSG